MDFSFTSDQDELRELARRILNDRCTLERLKEVRDGDTGVDLALWREMADLGLVGIGMPEPVGGGGLGFAEVCVVLEEVGRFVAPVPALPVMAMAAPVIAEFGTEAQLEGLASGERIVSVAVHELVGDVADPTTTATDGRLTGTKVCVPMGHVADGFVVSAADGLYLVAADADGVTVERQDTVDDIPDAMVTLDGAPGEKLTGTDGLAWMVERGLAAQSVLMAGVAAQALEITSGYVKERVQFDRVIATFQAVAQRAADSRIDSEAIWLTAWQAAMRIHEGLDASEQVATAKFWAAEGGQRVVHAATHLHGGVGVDRDYPLHRYYLMTKHQELFLGGTTQSLLRLGQLLADTPV